MAVVTEEVVPTSQETSILHGKWDLYFHLPNDKDWKLSSYKIIHKDISNVDDLINTNEYLSEKIVKYCMLFVMRSGITPMWEDPQNRKGGCFSYKILNKNVKDVWKNLTFALVGESLIEGDLSSIVNGITISTSVVLEMVAVISKEPVSTCDNRLEVIAVISRASLVTIIVSLPVVSSNSPSVTV